VALLRMLDGADKTLYALSQSDTDDPMKPTYFDLMRSLRLKRKRLQGATHAELGMRLGAILTGRQIAPSRHAGRDLLLEETLVTEAMASRVQIAGDNAADAPSARVTTSMAVAQGIDDFSYDYVGAVPLAKDYGEFVL
jgi:hypothetical protein